MGGRPSSARREGRRRAGQSLVEAALVIPAILALLCGMWAVAVVLRAHLGLESAVYEAARAGALTDGELAAREAGAARGAAVAADYGLGPDQRLALAVTLPEGFARGGVVQVDGTALVAPRDVPLFGRLTFPLTSRHREPIGRWRSLGPPGEARP